MSRLDAQRRFTKRFPVRPALQREHHPTDSSPLIISIPIPSSAQFASTMANSIEHKSFIHHLDTPSIPTELATRFVSNIAITIAEKSLQPNTSIVDIHLGLHHYFSTSNLKHLITVLGYSDQEQCPWTNDVKSAPDNPNDLSQIIVTRNRCRRHGGGIARRAMWR